MNMEEIKHVIDEGFEREKQKDLQALNDLVEEYPNKETELMKVEQELIRLARKHNINLVVSGHMSCDSIGVNLICDLWEREGIKVLPCSGFTRYSRN